MSNLDVLYPVMEHFYTIQGEGFYTGHAAYFVRLGGCNVGCVWCDVKESWDVDAHPKISVQEIIDKVIESGTKICVITGGEPAMHDLNPLIDELKSNNIRSHIETSGAYPLQGNPDWICLSPKKFKFPIIDVLSIADEFKPVIFHHSDIQWAESYTKDLNSDCKLYLQTEWSKSESNLPIIIEYVKSNPQWQISLQTHKYLNIP
jgi:organic radical activating enzyme